MDREALFRIQQGKQLRKARKQANMSQTDVAAKFGITQDAISKYERGLSNINTFRLIEMSKLYEKPITFFFMDTPTK